MLKFLRKHIKSTGFTIGVLALGTALLAGATPFIAILVALTLTFLFVTALKKTGKSEPAPDLPSHHTHNDRRSSVPSTILPSISPLPSPIPQSSLDNQVAKIENQAIQALEEMSRRTQEIQAQHEANRKAAQQKIEEMTEKYVAQKKDLENKKEETIRKKQEQHRKK